MNPKNTPLHRKIELSHSTQKPFPFSDKAEKYVLGALLLDSNAIVHVASILSPKHFYNDSQAKIYEAIKDLFTKGQGIDVLTVYNRCESLFKDFKITAYEISGLANNVTFVINIVDHAEIIKTKWGQREMMRIANKMLYLAPAPTFDLPEMLGEFGAELMQLNREAIPDKTESDSDILLNILDDIITPKHGVKGLSTGIPMLDDICDGMEGGDFIIIGGRPGMGKTALLTTIAQFLAFDKNTSIGFVSYEMTKKRIFQRIISLRACIDSRKLGKEKFDEVNMMLINNVANTINSNKNFHFLNGRGLDVVGLRAKAIELKQSKGIKALFIDYLQRIPLLKSVGRKSTHDAIGANTQALSELALELDIPILCPCQLNRNGEGRPTLKNLRDSGKIEDDAVKVWFIHRPEYYNIEKFDNGDDTQGKAEIIQAKNRNGEIGNTVISFDAPTTRFFSGGGEIEDDVPF